MTQENELPKNKAELLERIHRSRAALEKMISALAPEELETPLPTGWAVKDHLAHLAAWELGIAELLRRRPRFNAMQVEEVGEGDHSEDEINDLIFQRHTGMTTSETMEYFHAAHRQMIEALDGLDDADLYRPYHEFLQDGEEGPENPVIHWIIGNTYEHFDLHRGYIDRE
jgi:hypothetical protein